ncbi:ectonucleotide pyrophosphatase/phosphodiesterase [Brevundimonas sp.]|uniref:alkaline phosphatase family protein n=1 Tax=Brevundimonas sp. TaxID=1871086 RepID=UPI002622F177|nr:ectonucleotide pyrophosphatase/phosphodiesterase [Brevundimonas sp.]
MFRVLFACIALLTGLSTTAHARNPADPKRPLTILISIDGFRPDYMDRGVTPTLSALAAEGTTAAMQPSFPSVTFPNHYTLVTGLHPDHHGIVGNSFNDPGMGRFTMQSKEAGWWNQAEPIWVTAEKGGLLTATMFWPGSETAIDNVRPTYWRPFDQTVTGADRVWQVLTWLDGTGNLRPDFVTLYFDVVDTAGHRNGPDAAETTAAVASVDHDLAGLVQGLKDRGLYDQTTFVIVADHGMAATSPDRVTYLDDLIDPAAIQIVYAGPVVYLDPASGHEAEVEAALIKRHPHGECWPRADIPDRFVLGSNPRVSSIVCLADTGWLFGTRARTVTRPGGAHGYDNQASEMRALFIATGPRIASGVVLPAMDSVDVHPLLARLLGLTVPAGDGRPEDTLPAMRAGRAD